MEAAAWLGVGGLSLQLLPRPQHPCSRAGEGKQGVIKISMD